MLRVSTYELLTKQPAIQPFQGALPKVVGVGGASPKIHGYGDVPFEIDDVVLHHALLVVDILNFFLIVGMDILRPHNALLFANETAPIKF